jgi:hypothetical protein
MWFYLPVVDERGMCRKTWCILCAGTGLVA